MAVAASSPPVPTPPPITGFTTITIAGQNVTLNPSVIVLLIGLGLVGWMIWQAQRSSKPFDLRDLVMVNGHLDAARTTFLGAFIVSSWVIVDSQIKARLTEGMYGLYLGAWAITLIAKVIYDAKEMPKIPLLKNQEEK